MTGSAGKALPEVEEALAEVLDDLCFRFLNNLPASEYESFERLFFAVESAHWFYDDFYRDRNRKLPKLQLREFSALVFQHSPVLRPYAGNVDALTAQFRSYKRDVPVCGAALLNADMTKVVLVKGWGAGGKWGFPKGKIGKDESELNAAIREVREETGFDFTPLINRAEEPQTIDSYTSGRLCRIFMVHKVPEDTIFKTNTRKEIAKIQWVPISALPDPKCKNSSTSTPESQQFQEKNFSKAWLVSQYTPKLRSYIKRRRKALRLAGEVPPKDKAGESKQGPPSSSLSAHAEAGGAVSSTTGKAAEGRKRAKRDNDSGGDWAASTVRDITTFGIENGSGRMSDQEREDLFRAYVQAADKRAAEMGLGDDFWPVPYVTSKDLAPRLETEPAAAAAAVVAVAGGANSLTQLSETHSVSIGAASAARSVDQVFSFDRARILACFSW